MYTSSSIFQTVREWRIELTGILNADHRMVLVKIVDENAPQMERGCWPFPKHLLRDQILTDFIQESGIEAEKKLSCLNGTRNDDQNPQKIFAAFKRGVMETARRQDWATVPKILQDLRRYEEELEGVNNDDQGTEEEKLPDISEITQKITELERKCQLK